MNDSMNASEFVKRLNSFSGNRLKRKNDLEILVNIVFQNDKHVFLEEAAFTAKYIQGLHRVLKKGSSNSEINNIDQIKIDYTENIKKAVSKLKEIINLSDKATISYFEKNYFELSPNSFQNLSDFLEDLEWTKMYLNDEKRKDS